MTQINFPEKYTILRWDAENNEFGWYLHSTDDYDYALESAASSAKESRLSTDLLGIRNNRTQEIIALALKLSPDDLPLSLVQIYELKE